MLVVIESPLGAPTRELIELNKTYARACMRDSLSRGEAPYASHLMFDQPGILDDLKPEERALGMMAGFAWGVHAAKCVVYLDRGFSDGMHEGVRRAALNNIPIEWRKLYGTLTDHERQFFQDRVGV
jgi:hypothetical protein